MAFNKLWTIIVINVIAIFHTYGIYIPNQQLIFSNYPENIHYPQIIFDHSTNEQNTRYHFYHINKTPHTLYESISIQNTENKPITINTNFILNKSYDGSKVAHKNSLEFWKNTTQFNQIVIPNNETIILNKKSNLAPNEITHGIIQISNPNKHKIKVSLRFKDNHYKKLPLNHLKPIIYNNNKTLTQTIIPNNELTVIPIGSKDLHVSKYNHGNYGQIHKINLNFINPFPYALESIIYYNSISGMARNTLIINNNIFLAKDVLSINKPEEITTITIPPNSTPSHNITLFPESGNFYPIEIIISALKRKVNDS